MKQLSTLLIFFICYAGYGQQTNVSLLDTYIKQSSPETYFTPAAKVAATTLRLVGLREQVYDAGVYLDLDSASFDFDPGYGMQLLDLLSPYYTECAIVQWDGFIWIPYALLVNTHDGDHLRTSMEISFWDGAVYVPAQRYSYTYDENDRVVELLIEYYILGVYENYQRNIYTYTLAGKLDYYITESWTGADWENFYRFVYTYNAEELTSNILIQNYIGGSWEDDSRNVYLYDLDNHLTSDTYQNADGVGGFEDVYRYIYAYDGSGFLITQTYQSFTGVWENYSKNDYDNNGEGLPDIQYSSTWDGVVWIPTLRVYNWYEEYESTAINNIAYSDELNIFPNPASGEITVEFTGHLTNQSMITITDLHGKIVQTDQMPGAQSSVHMSTENLPVGFYHISISDGNDRYVSGFVKQ